MTQRLNCTQCHYYYCQQCRRYAPIPINKLLPGADAVACWPVVTNNDWCGEWKKKESKNLDEE